MRKRALSILLCATLALSLAACGSGQTGGNQTHGDRIRRNSACGDGIRGNSAYGDGIRGNHTR